MHNNNLYSTSSPSAIDARGNCDHYATRSARTLTSSEREKVCAFVLDGRIHDCQRKEEDALRYSSGNSEHVHNIPFPSWVEQSQHLKERRERDSILNPGWISLLVKDDSTVHKDKRNTLNQRTSSSSSTTLLDLPDMHLSGTRRSVYTILRMIPIVMRFGTMTLLLSVVSGYWVTWSRISDVTVLLLFSYPFNWRSRSLRQLSLRLSLNM